MSKKAKNTICLWFNKDAQDAARFYAAAFPNSEVTAIHKAPGDFPGGKEGEILTVEFTVFGIPCLGLNGGPEFPHTEAFSFQIANGHPGGNGSLLEGDYQQGRRSKVVRLVQRPMGNLLANHAARVDGRDGGRRRGSQTRLCRDDGHGKNRRRQNRGRSPQVRVME